MSNANDPEMPVGYSLYSFDAIDSTNAEALRRIDCGAKPGDVIWARRQNSGRGRRGREWVSPRGNLYFTLILSIPTEQPVGQLAFVTALGMADALQGWVRDETPIRLKWPNDVLLRDKKLGGILIEHSTNPVGNGFVAVGIGLNVETAPLATAVCLRDVGITASLPDLLQTACREFDRWYRTWCASGFKTVRESWVARAAGLEKQITVQFPDGRSTDGIFGGIDQNGALELWRPDGTCETIATGEVFFPAT